MGRAILPPRSPRLTFEPYPSTLAALLAALGSDKEATATFNEVLADAGVGVTITLNDDPPAS